MRGGQFRTIGGVPCGDCRRHNVAVVPNFATGCQEHVFLFCVEMVMGRRNNMFFLKKRRSIPLLLLFDSHSRNRWCNKLEGRQVKRTRRRWLDRGLIVPHATNLLAMVPDALANTCTVYLQLAVSLGRQARWRAPVPASWPRHPRRVRHLSPPRVVDHLRARA